MLYNQTPNLVFPAQQTGSAELLVSTVGLLSPFNSNWASALPITTALLILRYLTTETKFTYVARPLATISVKTQEMAEIHFSVLREEGLKHMYCIFSYSHLF